MGGSMGSTPSPSTGSGSHMLMGSRSDFLGGDAGDVRYPYHLFNGKAPDQSEEFPAKAGEGDPAPDHQRGRGHRLQDRHSRPEAHPHPHRRLPRGAQGCRRIVLGMGERIDALVTVADGYTRSHALPGRVLRRLRRVPRRPAGRWSGGCAAGRVPRPSVSASWSTLKAMTLRWLLAGTSRSGN